MVWSCPLLRPYWEAVASTIGDICGTRIQLDPLTLLLSHFEEVEGDRYTKLCIAFSLFYARREILLRWKLAEQPMLDSWQLLVNSVLPFYRLAYESRQCPGKFNKVWSGWIDACG